MAGQLGTHPRKEKQKSRRSSPQTGMVRLRPWVIGFGVTSAFVLACGERRRNAPHGIRTRVPALRGPCPRPLDEGGRFRKDSELSAAGGVNQGKPLRAIV